VRDAPEGPRRRIWAGFYFVEGVELWWQCSGRGIRHIHAHFANVGADLARVAARFGRDSDPDEAWSWSFTMHGYTEFSDVSRFDLPGKANDADAVVCISDYARSQIMMLCEPDRWPRLHIVHCGVDVRQFSPLVSPSEPHPLRLLFLGRLVFEKGPVVLVEALGLLRASGVDAELTIVGEGPARQRIEQSVRDLGLTDHVELVGAVPPNEARTHYQRADVFCLPSFAEGVPVVLMEAMSCGLPVVTTYITGVPELVTDGVEGFTVTPGRADRIADALRELTDSERRRAMGTSGRKKVEVEFDLTMVGPLMQAVFEPLPGT
jgi:glycosyltransferase involved in cell wall biosynthesis